MKKYLLHIVLFFCLTQQFYSQEDGIVAFNIPARNSLKFNKYIINPTFSFVREQNKYLSFTNKREWVQFDDAPQTYLFSYSGALFDLSIPFLLMMKNTYDPIFVMNVIMLKQLLAPPTEKEKTLCGHKTSLLESSSYLKFSYA